MGHSVILLMLQLIYVYHSDALVINSDENSLIEHGNTLHSIEKEDGKHFLWEIKGNSPSYLFGTIHVPFNKIWDSIPENMMQAFNNSKQIILELDMNEATLSTLFECEKLPNGQKVSEVLPEKLYRKWMAYLKYLHSKITSWITPQQKSSGLTANIIFSWLFENWPTRRPIWTLLKSQMVIENYIQSIGYLQLDTYLAHLGRRFGKIVDGIENVEETCSIINNLNESQVLFILDKTLDLDYEVLTHISTRDLDNLIDRYRSGDISPAYFSQKFGFFPQIANNKNVSNNESIYINNSDERKIAMDIHTYLRDEIIFNRNEIMAKRIIKLIQENPDTSFFFAFGVGHFIGQGSVVDLLRQQNFRVDRISPDTSIRTSISTNVGSNSTNISRSSENCNCGNHELFPWFICVVKCVLGF